jgi:lysozyme
MFNREFADISSNNNKFEALRYRDTGHILVGIKATEGINYTNPYHRTWSLNAGLQWVSVVHYHFARPDQGNDPAHEAQRFLAAALPLAGWWDYLCLDLERATRGGWQHDPAWSQAFDKYVLDHSRFRVILYANRSTLEQSDKWLVSDKKRVWDADWSNAPDYAPPGYECVFRQLTNGVFGPEPHAVPGVGICDVNRMSGAMLAELTERYRH